MLQELWPVELGSLNLYHPLGNLTHLTHLPLLTAPMSPFFTQEKAHLTLPFVHSQNLPPPGYSCQSRAPQTPVPPQWGYSPSAPRTGSEQPRWARLYAAQAAHSSRKRKGAHQRGSQPIQTPQDLVQTLLSARRPWWLSIEPAESRAASKASDLVPDTKFPSQPDPDLNPQGIMPWGPSFPAVLACQETVLGVPKGPSQVDFYPACSWAVKIL